jgi:malic enzyme
MSEIKTIRIGVIGVGSAGLAALKQAVDAFSRPEVVKRVKLELVGFETRAEVGGLW